MVNKESTLVFSIFRDEYLMHLTEKVNKIKKWVGAFLNTANKIIKVESNICLAKIILPHHRLSVCLSEHLWPWGVPQTYPSSSSSPNSPPKCSHTECGAPSTLPLELNLNWGNSSWESQSYCKYATELAFQAPRNTFLYSHRNTKRGCVYLPARVWVEACYRLSKHFLWQNEHNKYISLCDACVCTTSYKKWSK